MSESLFVEGGSDEPRGPVGRGLRWACQSFALAGGLILLLLIGMSLLSILGRKLFARPIRGDIELMEIGASVAIASFLPLCELYGHHIKVDALTAWLPTRAQALLDALAHLLCLGAALLLAWRTALQVHDNYLYGDTSTLLGVPLWIPLLLIVPSLLLLACASAYRIATHLCPGCRP